MKATKSIIIFLFFFNQILAQEYTISGNAGTYTGDTLRMYVYSDYITKTKKLISKTYVEENGDFSFTLSETKTKKAFIDLDVFIGNIIIEPNKNLKIVLPKKTVRSEYDRMNPYFKPFKFYIRVLNDEKNITLAIKHFNKLFKNSLKIIFKDKKHINPGLVEKEIIKINDSTSYIKDPFFINFKKYKFLYLRHITYYKNKKAIVRKNFSKDKFIPQNPAYNEFLTEKFGTFVFETNGDTLYHFLSANYGWRAYMNFLSKNEIYKNKEFREYFLLLNLYKKFYKDNTFQKSIIKLLHSTEKEDISKLSRTIINNFLDKSGRLILGNPVSNFSLFDSEDEKITLSDFQDKFVYLSFYNKDSYACQKDIEILNQLYEKKKDMLEIITIFADKNTNYIKELKKEGKYNWTILQCSESDKVLKNYKVVSFPTYYLIHPNGTLLLLPAPGPAEDFEAKYFKIYQEWKRKKIRRESNQSNY